MPEQLPPEVRFANYRGDHRGSIGRLMGPNMLGEFVRVVSAEFDAEANRTRLGFSFLLGDAAVFLHQRPEVAGS